MNTLIIQPNLPQLIEDYLVIPSLDIPIISAYLKEQGVNVDFIDMRVNKYQTDILESLIHKDYELVVIEGTVLNHSSCKDTIVEIRRLLPESKILLRGEVTTFLPIETLNRIPELDISAMYDSEYTIYEVLTCIQRQSPFSNIQNIAYRNEESEVIINTVEKSKNCLDALPFPDYDIYDYDKYLKFDHETVVKSSRGCPGSCKFCNRTQMSRFRLFSISRFVDEIEILMSKGFKSFFFQDDTFAFSDKRVEDLQTELIRRNIKIKWTSNIRIKDITEKRVRLMKQAGAYRVFVGLETFNLASSKIINKNLSIKEIEEKIAILKKHDLEVHTSFIVGSPGDSIEDLKNTMRVLKEIKPTIATFNMLKLFPGTDIYNNPENYGIICNDMFWFEGKEWTQKNVIGTHNLPSDVIEDMSKWMYKEFIEMSFNDFK